MGMDIKLQQNCLLHSFHLKCKFTMLISFQVKGISFLHRYYVSLFSHITGDHLKNYLSFSRES